MLIAANNPVAYKILDLRTALCQLWEDATATNEDLIKRLKNWCHSAQQSGIPELSEFSLRLRRLV
ncbi:DesA/ISL3 alpha bundle tail domain-containing protein [Advenella mimigardefordensis]